jgi:hypothetical protein
MRWIGSGRRRCQDLILRERFGSLEGGEGWSVRSLLRVRDPLSRQVSDRYFLAIGDKIMLPRMRDTDNNIMTSSRTFLVEIASYFTLHLSLK